MSLKPCHNLNKKFINKIKKYFELSIEKILKQVISIKRVVNNNNIILKNKAELQNKKLDTFDLKMENQFCMKN